MHNGPAVPSPVAATPTQTARIPLKFQPQHVFRTALRDRIDEYFERTGKSRRDCVPMYVKTAIVLGSMATVYGLLVFGPVNVWMAIPLTILLGLSLAAVGFNVQHDGGHGAYSRRRWINTLAASTLDLLGASSYIWDRKHNSVHHSYTNITGHDDDINLGWLGRLSPHQPRLWFHRFQHFYLWFLYGLLPVKWQLFDDFRDVVTRRAGGHRLPRPTGWQLVRFVAGKVCFFSLAFVIPLLLHPWWVVLLVYFGVCLVQGIVLSVVFQLAHCVEEAEFPLPQPDSGRMATGWAEHQVQTTADFARGNRWLTWFVGGLNFQIEHHLFPQICHVHYPALAPLVEQTCQEFDVRYTSQPSLRSAIGSHYRWLRRMGAAPVESEAEEHAGRLAQAVVDGRP
jgi:linoleoyl-CoA desaturase